MINEECKSIQVWYMKWDVCSSIWYAVTSVVLMKYKCTVSGKCVNRAGIKMYTKWSVCMCWSAQVCVLVDFIVQWSCDLYSMSNLWCWCILMHYDAHAMMMLALMVFDDWYILEICDQLRTLTFSRLKIRHLTETSEWLHLDVT